MKITIFHLTVWVSLCTAALVGYGFWYAAVANESTTVAGLQNQIDTKTETASRIASARTALAEIAGDESVVQSYFVPDTAVVPFIDDLQVRARAQNATMKVLSVSVGTDVAEPTLILSLTITGTFDAVMRTVGAVEYAPYDLSLSKLSLGKSDKNIWSASTELIVGSVPASTATSTKAVGQTVTFSSFSHYGYF